jgi:chemotaxis protein methyltransferase CheR
MGRNRRRKRREAFSRITFRDGEPTHVALGSRQQPGPGVPGNDPAAQRLAMMQPNLGLDRAVFDKFRVLIYETCGITLSENKEALVASRIGKRMRTLGITDYGQYYGMVTSDRSGNEMTELVNSISTNVTHFFREPRHFELLAEWLKDWTQKQNRRPVRIWSAACSTGEEPYSICMTALDALGSASDVQIMASDISTKVIQIAKFGVYKPQDIQNIPLVTLKKHFQVGGSADAELYRVKPALRDMVAYQQINLSTPPYAIQGQLDVIFCRNVMIYFNRDLRKLLVRSFQDMLRPGGFLVVGLAESLSGIQHDMTVVEPSVYRKR